MLRRRGQTHRPGAHRAPVAAAAAGALLAAGCGGGLEPPAAEPSAAQPRPAEPSAARGEGDRARHQLARVRRADRSPIALLERPTVLRSTPGGRSVARLETETEFDSPRVLAVLDDRQGWLEVMAPELPNGDSGWIRAGVAALGGTSYSLRASLSERELEVRRHDRVVRRVTVAVGAPGTPTPTGTFAVTDKLEVTAADSPYGCCALALTGHQPNVAQGWSGGDRLAVHATADPESIGTAVSLGCLRAADADMRWLVERIPLGTLATFEP